MVVKKDVKRAGFVLAYSSGQGAVKFNPRFELRHGSYLCECYLR